MNAKEVIEKYNAVKKSFMAEMKQAFMEGSKELFKQCPQIASFEITAYTPYFNDGDVCEYSVGCYEINPKEGISFRWDTEPYRTVSKVVNSFVKTFPDEFYRDVFGDHIKIIVNPDSVEATEYEHD